MKEDIKNDLIDIHSHILPGLDDGSRSVSESVEMAKIAASCGVRTIVATPHRIKGPYENSIEEIRRNVSFLDNELVKNKIPISLLSGAENYSEFNIDLRSTINNTRYFLIEFPIQSYPLFCDDIIDDLISKGITPVVTDAETNHDIRHDPSIVEKLIRKGCLMQLNASSLFSGYKTVRDFSLFMLKNGAYHVFASNAHRPKGYENYSKALDILNSYVGEDKFIEMTYEVPRRIISDKDYYPESIRFKEKRHTKLELRAFVRRLLHL